MKNEVLKKLAGLKHELLGKPKVEKKCITKPTKSIGKPKCTHSRKPKTMPKGWKTDRKIYDDGRCTKVSHVEAHLKANK